ncbi:hypothetical protein FISHEDRAFT_59867 [Fistulina hepatica ATCC 64428]|uniref:Uncharacterized protein n=1 Tax=Fistulina hepatica ATCC 64428 TaxID=1128425 RepID=A0A0D7A8J0_9AGAR|nr:hypothetical protein FISHEDRAFT_59867 [Fistulina hepatica ATCC 64428]
MTDASPMAAHCREHRRIQVGVLQKYQREDLVRHVAHWCKEAFDTRYVVFRSKVFDEIIVRRRLQAVNQMSPNDRDTTHSFPTLQALTFDNESILRALELARTGMRVMRSERSIVLTIACVDGQKTMCVSVRTLYNLDGPFVSRIAGQEHASELMELEAPTVQVWRVCPIFSADGQSKEDEGMKEDWKRNLY